MNKSFTYVLAIAVSLATTAMLNNGHRTINSNANFEARMQIDGAFRDGLYLGRLAAEGGQLRRPAIGRWSTEQDRDTFTTGYRRGYDGVLAAVTAKRIALGAKAESR